MTTSRVKVIHTTHVKALRDMSLFELCAGIEKAIAGIDPYLLEIDRRMGMDSEDHIFFKQHQAMCRNGILVIKHARKLAKRFKV